MIEIILILNPSRLLFDVSFLESIGYSPNGSSEAQIDRAIDLNQDFFLDLLLKLFLFPMFPKIFTDTASVHNCLSPVFLYSASFVFPPLRFASLCAKWSGWRHRGMRTSYYYVTHFTKRKGQSYLCTRHNSMCNAVRTFTRSSHFSSVFECVFMQFLLLARGQTFCGK